ncbi:MAG: hypothetical protein ACSHYA_19640 [Opitutaceae bacterium]
MTLKPEIKNALIATHRLHGSKAKEAIISSWHHGSYFIYGLSEYSDGLQRLRNCYDAYDLLNDLDLAKLN